MVVKKKYKPRKFKPMNLSVMVSVKDRWRRPRGTDNKQRVRERSAPPCPRIGYKNAANVRFLHPSGLKEVLVHNMKELLAAGKGVLVRIAGGVGGKKKAELKKKAGELKVPVAN
jgi:large subunit ribosomal protein L32e